MRLVPQGLEVTDVTAEGLDDFRQDRPGRLAQSVDGPEMADDRAVVDHRAIPAEKAADGRRVSRGPLLRLGR